MLLTVHEYIRDCFQFSKRYVGHHLNQETVVSLLLGCLPIPQGFYGIGIGLAINQSVVSGAKENEIVVNIALLLR